MKLDFISLSQFRCFQKLQIGLEPDVTLLVGINGAGKTAVLDAISLSFSYLVGALSGKNTHTAELVTPEFRPADVSSTSGLAGMVEISVTLGDWNYSGSVIKNLLPSASMTWDSKYSPSVQPSTYEDLPSDRALLYLFAKRLWGNLILADGSVAPLPMVAYYRSDRKLSGDVDLGDVFNANFGRESAFESTLNAGADYKAMCQWLYLAENQVLREANGSPSPLARTYRAMGEALRLLIASIHDFRFEGLPPSLLFQVGENGHSRQMSLLQLSDGYRTLIGICLDFARRIALANPHSEEPLKLPGILLIDEIELHLHASWQQTVIPKLREIFPNTQIIATTHSPQVLTSVEDRCIRILDGQNVHAAPSGTWGAESKRLLEDVLGVSSRPPERFAEPVKQLHELQDLIDQGKYEEAKAKIDEFISKGYEADPAIIDANLAVENRLWEEAHTG